jgi:hypothetical protein
MSDRTGAPLTALYFFAAACGLFGAAYGALQVQPSPAMALLLGWGPAVAVACWLAADSKQHRIINVQDVGLFFYITWPLTLPWYAWRSRGRAGWGLAARLYAMALIGQLGFILGATLRYLLAP